MFMFFICPTVKDISYVTVCGRFVRYISIPEIADEFDAVDMNLDLGPSYNIPPGQDIIMIVKNGRNRIIPCKWGFIPSWTDDPSMGYKMINARAESVAEKASFRDAFKRQRCLIPANGFYDWRKEGKARVPVYVRLKSRQVFGFAGLYNEWTSPEGKQICTTTIITTGANSLLAPVHDRMPAIIPREKESLWLDSSIHDREILLTLLKPYPSEDMEFREVSRTVNSPGNDSPECIKPVK
jgi:putative SOS response-associated peptidase YedK